MIDLTIDRTTCIKCSKCVRVCPSHIFYQEREDKEIKLKNIQTCIKCGHCVAICPTDSVIHSNFPSQKVHKIDKQLLPTPEQVDLLIKSRRSNRAFSKKPVPKELIDQILEAAHRAPTASNKQQVEFTVITDPQVLHQISALTIDVFISVSQLAQMIKPILKHTSPEILSRIPVFEKMKKSFEKGDDLILRKATAVILIHTPKDSRFGCQDSNLAYQNASLMAESLGVAQFYTGFVCAAVGMDKRKRKLSKLLDIKGNIHAGIALGMPDFRFTNYIDKKEIKVNWI